MTSRAKLLITKASTDNTRRSRRWLLGVGAAFAAVPGVAAAAAVRHHAAAKQPEKPPEEQPAQAEGVPTAVAGFRSARFGMNEEEVRQAIHKDFPNAAGTLRRTTNLSEKTTVLTLTVPDIVPDSGEARASYIFGYESKKLIQVNVNWRSDGKTEASDQGVINAANKLRDYFVAETFAANSVLVNRKLNNATILVFRGADAAGHVVAVILSGTSATARAAKKPPPPPLSLELAYIENSAHPDIFRLPKGMF